ncbi:MAG: LysR family transcriptional regulator [Bradymonadaceae bacterium]|nr:LysR family transcriptional regulator [Lujinxingiaceae bacterium]
MRLSELDLNLLPYLDAVLQMASVTRAAERVGLSAPAMSHALARLREMLDDELLVRSGRSMVLTERAEALRPRVRALIEEIRSTIGPTGPLDLEHLERLFQVRATDYVIDLMLPTIEELIGERAPRMTLQFLPNRSDDAEALHNAQFDLGVGVYGDLPATLRIRKLVDDGFVCVVRRGHPLVGKPLTLERYVACDHVQVAPRGRAGGRLDDHLFALGYKRHIARAVPYFRSALEMTAKSDYLLTVSARLAYRYATELDLVIFELPFEMTGFTLSMLWHARHQSDPAHAWLRGLFASAASSLEALESLSLER